MARGIVLQEIRSGELVSKTGDYVKEKVGSATYRRTTLFWGHIFDVGNTYIHTTPQTTPCDKMYIPLFGYLVF